MNNFALPRNSCMYSTRSMPHAEYPCDGAGRYPQSAMHCFMPTGYAGVYPHASSYPGMPHGYGYGCGPLEMMPGAALGPRGLGYVPCSAAMVGPSAVGGDEDIVGMPDRGDEHVSAIKKFLNSYKNITHTEQGIKQILSGFILRNVRKIPDECYEMFDLEVTMTKPEFKLAQEYYETHYDQQENGAPAYHTRDVAPSRDARVAPPGLIKAMTLPIWGSFTEEEAHEVCIKFNIKNKDQLKEIEQAYSRKDQKTMACMNELSRTAKKKLTEYFIKLHRLSNLIVESVSNVKINKTK